ncbi:MAG: alkaline phosphatase family protein [Planctomycetota bacterium]|nr:alkaline phosphatase family protein [Planctomycetota bacterium]
MRKKTVVIGLDGTPYSLIQKLTQQGACPNLSKLISTGSLREMKSTHPAVSSVAWTSFMTGVNPAKHGIFGFVERIPNTYDVYYPNSKHVMSKTIWDIIRNFNKRSVIINVPSTYPASEMNGILIAGFVAIDLVRASFPSSVVPALKEMGYKIDVETQLIHESKDKLFDDLFLTLERRTNAILHFMKNEIWDLFIGIFTETDRLHHFFWEFMESNDPKYSPLFLDYYKKVDDAIGKIVENISNDTTLILLSDHGFCGLKHEVNINCWLKNEGFLNFKTTAPKSLSHIGEGTKAYCLDPGRIYINLRGREPNGCVEPGKDYEQLRDTLISKLIKIKDPVAKTNIIDKVHKREEIYHGKYFDRAPDLVIEPKHGYDIKGAIDQRTLFSKGVFSGMHTYDDAFVYINHKDITKHSLETIDVTATILASLDIPIPEDMDGINFVKWN